MDHQNPTCHKDVILSPCAWLPDFVKDCIVYHLQNTIEGPEAAEPHHGVAKAKQDVDNGSGHEATSQHDSW